MPSPFPGMDPYLEDPGFWPGFHNSFADRICTVLNEVLPSHLYAQLEMRSEMGILGDSTHRIVVPDVSIQSASVRQPTADTDDSGGLAVAARPRTEDSPSVRISVEIESYELASVAIRDSTRGRELVTLIEMVSPSNKRPGPDRDRYLAKLDETLASSTSLVEIDLLRRGTRSWIPPRCAAGVFTFDPPADYLVVVNRSWERGIPFQSQAFPIRLPDALPVIPVPLRQEDGEVNVDLQYCFRIAYRAGPYRRGGVDYDQPPSIPLPEALEAWRNERILAWRANPPRSSPATPP